MTIKKYLFLPLCAISLILGFGSSSLAFAQTDISVAQEETLEGKVTNIIEEKQVQYEGSTDPQLYQRLQISIVKGSKKGSDLVIENGNFPMSNIVQYKLGDELVISASLDHTGQEMYTITDFVRRKALLWLFVIFVFVAVLIGRLQGVTSLIGMGISFVVIFKFILPGISSGYDPVGVAIVGALMIIPATFFMSHGINKKTLIAIAGTLIALVITGILAKTFVTASRLTGFASEEASFLQSMSPGLINIKGLLLAGIIIGVLGVLDDITVSQSAIVEQLSRANAKFSAKELYRKAMLIGKDHIASMVNTLVLVYAGAALPLLLLFIDNPHPFAEIVNYEIVADEIVRTLVGSIGLMLAVPITTFIATIVAKEKDLRHLI